MSLIKDKRGVSEEFTSLPALAVVMIGFALFFALIAGVYYSYSERVGSVDKYEAANFILEKLTGTDSSLAERGIIMGGGVIDKMKFENNMGYPDENEIIKESDIVGVKFGLKLEYIDPNSGYEKTLEWQNIPSGRDIVVASKQVAVYLNEAQTVPGVLSVIVWGV